MATLSRPDALDPADHAAVAVFVIDPDHRVIYWNRACEKLTGIKREEMLGTNHHWRAFYPHDRPCLSDILLDGNYDDLPRYYQSYTKSGLVEGGMHAEGWYDNLGGRRRYIIFDAAPVYNDEGLLVGVIETLQDITERKEDEEKNAGLLLELRQALEQTPDLSGYLVICAACKKIRDEEGKWIDLETYFRDRHQLNFSHGICMPCARKLYPDILK